MRPEHEAIIKDMQKIIREDWLEEDQNAFYLMGIQNDASMTSLHDTLGRAIRNRYNLLTIPWTPDIRDGIDYSSEHPDCISDTLLKELWNRGLQLKETT